MFRVLKNGLLISFTAVINYMRKQFVGGHFHFGSQRFLSGQVVSLLVLVRQSIITAVYGRVAMEGLGKVSTLKVLPQCLFPRSTGARENFVFSFALSNSFLLVK